MLADLYNTLYEKYVPKSIDLILKGIVDGEMGTKLQQVIPISNIDMVKQLCSVIDAFISTDMTDAMVFILFILLIAYNFNYFCLYNII